MDLKNGSKCGGLYNIERKSIGYAERFHLGGTLNIDLDRSKLVASSQQFSTVAVSSFDHSL